MHLHCAQWRFSWIPLWLLFACLLSWRVLIKRIWESGPERSNLKSITWTGWKIRHLQCFEEDIYLHLKTYSNNIWLWFLRLLCLFFLWITYVDVATDDRHCKTLCYIEITRQKFRNFKKWITQTCSDHLLTWNLTYRSVQEEIVMKSIKTDSVVLPCFYLFLCCLEHFFFKNTILCEVYMSTALQCCLVLS